MNLIRILALALTLVVPSASFAQEAPPTAPVLGGCWTPRLCFGPVITVSALALDLKSGQVIGSFAPSLGYGFKFNPHRWDSIEIAPILTFQSGPQTNLLVGGAVTFLKWASIGFAHQTIGDVKRPLILFGMNIPTP